MDTSNAVLPQLKVIQQSFTGGMKRSVDPTRLNDDQYTLLINGRSRYGTITPIKLPQQLTAGLPTSGVVQGCYGAGTVILIFIGGKAYYRDFAQPYNYFQLIKNFQMSRTAPTLWAELVPASITNYKRTSNDGNPSSQIIITSTVNGTPQAVVIQDGINQPWVIFPNGLARVTLTYEQWLVDTAQEYVPIGKQMLYIDGILYIVSQDGFKIYHSVTGRPLDFMVIVDKNGNKLPNKADGGADAVSHKIDYFPITCIARIDTPVQGGFLATTTRSSWIVAPDLQNLLFGEPTFTNTYLFSTGALNQFCVTDILGDTAFIDFNGLRSFNAVTQYRIEGKNSPFSTDIFAIFGLSTQNVIIQDANSVAAWAFDNYGFFSVNTIYGYGVAVYDAILKTWVGIDLYGTAPIKQFCEIKTNSQRFLFFITTDNKFYQAFASDQTANCKLYTKEYSTLDPEIEFTPEIFRAVWLDLREQGIAKVTPFVNRKRFPFIERQLPLVGASIIGVQDYPIDVPFGNSLLDTTENVTYNFPKLDRVWKVGYLVEWDFMADLSNVMMLGTPWLTQVSKKNQATLYRKASELLELRSIGVSTIGTGGHGKPTPHPPPPPITIQKGIIDKDAIFIKDKDGNILTSKEIL